MTDQEKIEIMQAHVDGFEIEAYGLSGWVETSRPSWDWHSYTYRIKPARQTPAEKFLEKNGGKKMRLSWWRRSEWFMPKRVGDGGKAVYGVDQNGCEDFWFSDDHNWQEWQEWQKPTPAKAFLEKWKGKKICMPAWSRSKWFMPDRVEGDLAYGMDKDGCEDDWLIDHNWQEWQEPTPAEVFLEKWKGKRVTCPQFKDPLNIDWVEVKGLSPSGNQNRFYGPTSVGECDDVRSFPIDRYWHEWQAPPRRLMTPEELAGKWIKYNDDDWRMITTTRGVDVENYEKKLYILGWADHPTGKLNESFYVEEGN